MPPSPRRIHTARAEVFARLFEVVHEGVFLGVCDDAATIATVAANPHLRLIFGYDAQTPDAAVTPFAPGHFANPDARTAFLERLAGQGAVTDYLLRMRRLDDSAIWVEITARAEPIGDGQTQIEALVRDVSERRRLSDQSRELYQQMLQTEKMAALGQTISGVAHELNNPLATILTWAERLARTPADDATRQGLGIIHDEAQRAARIVRTLLTFARKRQTTRSLVDVNDVVQRTLALRAYEQEAMHIDVVRALASGLPPVLADAYQLQQVLLNLFINAEQAMLSAHGRGTLVVRTWHDSDRKAVVLEVTDDGPGVPPDLKDRIFEPFFTTKGVGEGTGLGLTVAYAIVQDHGGCIRVESPAARQQGAHAEGPVADSARGATFIIELPANASAPPRPETTACRESAVRPAATAKAGRVLLVEDEQALATAVAGALTEAGYTVEHASDGEEALARVRNASYDLVICDLNMPRVDGMTVYRAIAALTPALARRVIFVTGEVGGADTARFLEDSGCRWLTKPFRLADLLSVVRDTLG